MDSADASNQPSELDVDALLVSLETAPPFVGHPTEYLLLKYLIELHRTGEIKAGKSKVVGDFRRHHVLSPTESRRMRVPWKDSAERALYRRLEGLLEIMNADPMAGIEIHLPTKGPFQLTFKRKQSTAAQPSASTPEELSASSTGLGKEGAPPAGDLRRRESEDPTPNKPLDPGEIHAEEKAKSAGFAFVRGRVFGLSLGSALGYALCFIAGAVGLWLLVRHRWSLLPTVLLYVVVGIPVLCSTMVAVASALRWLLKLRPRKRITIHVARLGTDQHGNDVSDLLIIWMRKQLNPNVARILTADIKLRVGGDEHEERSRREARQFVKKHDSDVLIWGSVYTLSQKDHLVARFSTPDFDHNPSGTFGFGEYYDLDSTFVPELGTAIAAVAAAMALSSLSNPRNFAVAVLEPAADRLSELIGKLDKLHAVDRGAVFHSYGLIQSVIGGQTGDVVRLTKAVDALRTATNAFDPKRVPLSWALAQNSLGLALMRLGSQEIGNDRMKGAASAFQAALDQLDELGPYRAAALYNLGLAFSEIGYTDSGCEHLKLGVAAFEDALKLQTVKNNRWMTAFVQNSLASNLIRLGAREKEATHLEQALKLTREIVATFEYAFRPVALTSALNIHAGALQALGKRQGRLDLLDEAVSTLRTVSKMTPRKYAALKWSYLQINIAATLLARAELEADGTSSLHEAAAVIRPLLDGPIRNENPWGWASAQNTLGAILLRLGQREASVGCLEEAEKAFRSTLEEWRRDPEPSGWATATNNLASTLTALGAQEQSVQKLEEAIAAFQDAAIVCTSDTDPVGWGFARNGLAEALLSLSLHKGGTALLEEAISVLTEVLKECGEDRSSALYKRTQRNLEDAFSRLGYTLTPIP